MDRPVEKTEKPRLGIASWLLMGCIGLLACFGLIGGLNLGVQTLITAMGANSLYEKPGLSQKFNHSPLQTRLKALSLATVRLSCDFTEKKVAADFQFHEVEGRKPVYVVGTTSCEDRGKALLTAQPGSNRIEAAENYDISLVEAEITALLTKAQLSPNPANRNNAAVAAILTKNYGQALIDQKVGVAHFKCSESGARFSYAAWSWNGGGGVYGKLKTTCATGPQSFTIGRVFPSSYSPLASTQDDSKNWTPSLAVHQYTDIPPELMVQVVGEFIEGGLVVSKF
jgi:hypothetical protein